jgi:hypothetical protein
MFTPRALPPPRAAATVARAAATGDVPPSPLAMPASLPSTLKLFLACSFVPLSSLLDCQSVSDHPGGACRAQTATASLLKHLMRRRVLQMVKKSVNVLESAAFLTLYDIQKLIDSLSLLCASGA